MSHPRPLKRLAARWAAVALAYTLTLAVVPSMPAHLAGPAGAVAAAQDEQQLAQIPVIAPGAAYRRNNLVSDWPGVAAVQDPLLVNPWGISFAPTGPFWVANAGSSTSTLYREAGGGPTIINPGLAAITIPPVPPPPPGGLPTGTVFNSGGPNDFFATSGSASARAAFLFASIIGTITAWSPNVPAAGSTTAVVMASQPGHVYTGLAIGSTGGNSFLYAADFANGNIDVFNGSYQLQPEASFPFVDPTLPPGYHPHNIEALGSELYVAYARPNPTPAFPGDFYLRPGGAVSVFDFNGTFKRRVATDGPLSAPWGLALSPHSFGVFGNRLLVGNFTFEDNNGRISAYDQHGLTGFIGQLQDEAGEPISIDGLWAIKFGNGGNAGSPNKLYFAAGIAHEQHGLFGSLEPTGITATSLVQFAGDDFAISEGAGHIDITVTRAGDVTLPASVNYATLDDPTPGHASQKSDYQSALGRLNFAAGETSKTFRVLLVDDNTTEPTESISLVLSNPLGQGVGLGSPNVATFRILNNDFAPSSANPIDDNGFFVRQHYLDFLNREPDPPGFGFWTNQLIQCGSDQECIRRQRVLVSAAFFLSIENQETGVLDILTHQAAYGAKPLYGQYLKGTQALQRNVIFGQPGATEQLEANKVAYFNEFVTRPEFVTRYPSTQTNAAFVDALLTSAALRPEDVRFFRVQMTNSQENPPVTPTSSNGGPRPVSFGTATFQFNQDRTSLTVNATVFNIDFTGSQSPGEANDNLTAAHIHAGPNATPANNPVVWGFIGLPFNDNNPNDTRVTPFTTGVGAEIATKWDAPEGNNNTTLTAQLTNIREGRAYINFHTTQFTGGEIRGNIPAADAFRNSLVAGLDNGTLTRAQVLRAVAEQEELKRREFNSVFVLMQYFGYLRRDPDPAGFQFWLNKLNQFNGDFLQAEMVRAFIESIEYRQRFGQ